jgi:uncharacterized protein YbjT (DUF2867 family)
MSAPILVTGGTGMLGQRVIRRLRDAGQDIRVLSRRSHATADSIQYVTGDLSTGEGIEAAVAGARIVVHCAGTAKGDEEKARKLMRAASAAGVRHLAFISVVGADRVPIVSGIDRVMFGYFGSKRAAERIVAESGVPWTTLRATQFQETLLKVVEGMAKLPVIPVPAGFRFQPVAVEEVATRLAELSLGEPAGLVSEMAGPRTYAMADLVRGYLRALHKHRAIVPVPTMGKAAEAFRGGANLSLDRAVGHRTWEDLLAEHVRA